MLSCLLQYQPTYNAVQIPLVSMRILEETKSKSLKRSLPKICICESTGVKESVAIVPKLIRIQNVRSTALGREKTKYINIRVITSIMETVAHIAAKIMIRKKREMKISP